MGVNGAMRAVDNREKRACNLEDAPVLSYLIF